MLLHKNNFEAEIISSVLKLCFQRILLVKQITFIKKVCTRQCLTFDVTEKSDTEYVSNILLCLVDIEFPVGV